MALDANEKSALTGFIVGGIFAAFIALDKATPDPNTPQNNADPIKAGIGIAIGAAILSRACIFSDNKKMTDADKEEKINIGRNEIFIGTPKENPQQNWFEVNKKQWGGSNRPD